MLEPSSSSSAAACRKVLKEPKDGHILELALKTYYSSLAHRGHFELLAGVLSRLVVVEAG